MEPMRHPMVWQGMGMVIGVYDLGYWWASYDPMQHKYDKCSVVGITLHFVYFCLP